MCGSKEGYFGLSAEELAENPQLRALVDDDIVTEEGWNQEEQQKAEERIADSKNQPDYNPSLYDAAK